MSWRAFQRGGSPAKLLSLAVKRSFDIAGAAGFLLATTPVWVTAALAIRKTMGSPILFRQERPGQDGEPFVMYKFRTMAVAKEGEGVETDGMRVTPLGSFLRKASIDEIPTMWNVLKGDMSLVGPRPLLMQYLERYSAEQARRMDVPPGVTGWAQVNGRNAISWEEKFDYDVYYVDNWSLWLDVQILFRTVGKVLGGRDINAANAPTMKEFMGSAPRNDNG